MYPPRFEYVAPTTLEEALATLAEHGDDAKVLAGGQSLIPLMKLRFAAPAIVVDLNRVDGLAGVDEEDGGLRIGAMTRHATLEREPGPAARWPLLTAAARVIADPLVRNLGTVGGSLAHADPAGDWASVMLAVRAELVARSTGGERTIAIDDFLRGTFTTALEPTEVLTEIRIPPPSGRAAGTYLKLERKVGDFATVGVAVQVELDDGRIRRAGIGLTAVGPQNLRAAAAEELLAGAEPSPELFAEAAAAAAQAVEPRSDVRGSADYKRAVVREFVRRGLAQAVAAAQAA